MTVLSLYRREDGTLFTADVTIYGHRLMLMHQPGGPKFTDAVSLSLNIDGQAESDRIWNAITAEGEISNCGWCRDKFGVTWQVSPIQMNDWLQHEDPEVSAYAWAAMMKMQRIVIDDLHV